MGHIFYFSNRPTSKSKVQINTLANHPLPEAYLFPASAFAAFYALSIAFRQYAHDRRALKEQLRSFSLQNAVCSDPGDRITILETILDSYLDEHPVFIFLGVGGCKKFKQV